MKTEANTYKESNSWGDILVAVLNAQAFCDLALKTRIADHAVCWFFWRRPAVRYRSDY